MTTPLRTLATLALGGSVVIVLLALAGRSTRARYSARWRCWAWLVLCLRLAIPVPLLPQEEVALIQVPVPPEAAVIQPIHPAPTPATPTVSEDMSQESSTHSASGATAPAQSTASTPVQPTAPTAPLRPSLTQVITALWLAGSGAVLMWSLAAHARFLAHLRRWSRPVNDADVIQLYNRLGDRLGLDRRPQILVCAGLPTPMLAGLIHPKLLLPEQPLGMDELGHSLLHELTHYKRRDIWLKTLALWVKALYWFSPFSWLLTRQVEWDTELACDEAALKLLPPEDRAAYGQTILAAVSRVNGSGRPQEPATSTHHA